MNRHGRRVQPLAIHLSIVATLLFVAWIPGHLNAQVPTSADSLLSSARQSPLFQTEILPHELRSRGLGTIQLQEGLKLQLSEYIQATRLVDEEALQVLQRPQVVHEFLEAVPQYDETVLQLDDRLVVDRILKVAPQREACTRTDAPDTVRRLCFTPKSGHLSRGMASDLEALRAKLRDAPRSDEFKDGVTVAEARSMSDEELLSVLLNSDERTIRYTSVIPLRVYQTPPRLPALYRNDFSRHLPASNLVLPSNIPTRRVQADVPATAVAGLYEAEEEEAEPPEPIDFGPRYFLTGFTFGREVNDTIEHTFANESWWHDRYYVRLKYHYSIGLGLRVPFAVSARAVGVAAGSDKRRVRLAVEPVDVDDPDHPAFEGVAAEQFFDGDELVLEMSAGCDFYASIPGPNLTGPDCPKVFNVDKSRSFTPSLGNESKKLADVMLLPSSVSGLQLDGGIGAAGIDLGIRGNMTEGEIQIEVAPLRARMTGSERAVMRYDSRAEQELVIEPLSYVIRDFGVLVQEPRYRAHIELMPLVQPWFELDLGVYEYRDEFGPYALDALAVDLGGFELERHEGTARSHRFVIERPPIDWARLNEMTEPKTGLQRGDVPRTKAMDDAMARAAEQARTRDSIDREDLPGSPSYDVGRSSEPAGGDQITRAEKPEARDALSRDRTRTDCTSYDPQDLAVRQIGDDWIVADGDHHLFALASRSEADAARDVARRHTELCFVGRDNDREERDRYVFGWMAGDSGFEPGIDDEDCLPYDSSALRIVDEGARGFLVTDGRSRIQTLDTRADAERVLEAMENHTARCFVGRDNDRTDRLRYIVSYLKQ